RSELVQFVRGTPGRSLRAPANASIGSTQDAGNRLRIASLLLPRKRLPRLPDDSQGRRRFSCSETLDRYGLRGKPCALRRPRSEPGGRSERVPWGPSFPGLKPGLEECCKSGSL